MALINCELLRQALFLYVSMIGFITIHMSNSLFGTSKDTTNHTHIQVDHNNNNYVLSGSGGNGNIIIEQPASESGPRDSAKDSGDSKLQPDYHDNPSLEENPPWETASTCQTTFYQDMMAPTVGSPIALLERFDAENVSIPLTACSTLHLQAPLSSMVWCGVTDPEQMMEELHTLSYFLSFRSIDVLVVEGGGHHAGLFSILALSLGTSVHVISPYSHYLGMLEKSAVLSKLPTARLFLYHNQVSEIRGQVNLAYRPGLRGYRNDCDVPEGGVGGEGEREVVACETELVNTVTMEQAANSLRYSSAHPDDPHGRSLLVRVTFTNIHQINGFLDSPDMFSSWCVKIIIVDSALLSKEDKAWLEKRLVLLGYQAYTLSGKALTEQMSYHNKLTVWTTAPFIPH